MLLIKLILIVDTFQYFEIIAIFLTLIPANELMDKKFTAILYFMYAPF